MNPDRHPLAVVLPTDWTLAQALAVVELLDELRERLYSHYLIPIQTLLRDERTSTTTGDSHDAGAEPDDPPF
jgi:hypothetical protein